MIIEKNNFKFWVDDMYNTKFMIPIEKRYQDKEEKELESFLDPLWFVFHNSNSTVKELNESQIKLFKVKQFIPELVYIILNQSLDILHNINLIQDYLNPTGDLDIRYFYLRDILILNVYPTMYLCSFAEYKDCWNYQIEFNLGIEKFYLKNKRIFLNDSDIFNSMSFQDFLKDTELYKLNPYMYLTLDQCKDCNTLGDWVESTVNSIAKKYHDIFLNVFENSWDKTLIENWNCKIYHIEDESGEYPDTLYIQTSNDEAYYYNLQSYYVKL